MKCTVDDSKVVFKPVTFNITCESREELLELWHRFNLAIFDVKDKAYGMKYDYPSVSTTGIWIQINNVVESI